MALAIEFINVIVRKSAVERCFPGGLDSFARQDLANLAEDDHLLRVGFMGTDDALAFVAELEAAGLRYRRMESGSDIAVVWDGSAVPSWLTVGQVGGYHACWASEYPPGELVWPEPGFILRCPRGVYDSLADVVRPCGATIQEIGVGVEPGTVSKLRCRRQGAEIIIDVFGECEGDSPVALWGCRQLARRKQFGADVALIRDLVSLLTQAGAQDS